MICVPGDAVQCSTLAVHVVMQGKLQSSVGQTATAEALKGADPVTMSVSTQATGVDWECLLLVILMLTRLNIPVC